MHRNVLIAFNPKSGTGGAGVVVKNLESAVRQHGFQAQVFDSLEGLQREAARLQAGNCLEAVICAGGDGTVAALANLLPSNIPLLIFPLGTENLLAKHWGNLAEIEFACATLLARRCVQMDVGCANGKLFLVMLSCGFDAEVVQRMHEHRTGPIHRWDYAKPIFRTMFGYRFPQMILSDPDAPEQPSRSVPWLFVFNVPRYAANLQFCTTADPTDGRLDICTFRGSGVLTGLYYLYHVWRQRHENLQDYSYYPARRLRVAPPYDRDGEPVSIPFQIDGDPGGNLPLDIHVIQGRLRLLVPESTILENSLNTSPQLITPSYT